MSDRIMSDVYVDIPSGAEWSWLKTTAWLGAVVGSLCVWAGLIALVAHTAF
jgi:hypothetical protein